MVGCRLFDIDDRARGIKIPTLAMYPSEAPEAPTRLGPFTIDVAMGAAPSAGQHRAVIVSHGSGGTHFTHRELARSLAARGHVVLVPLHPRNNREDNSLEGTSALLEERPRDLRAVADWLHAGPLSAHVSPNHAVIGHSIGAYTALTVAGGRPSSLPHQEPDRKARLIETEADPRVAALVLLAPATPWYRLSGSLSRVTQPILMVASYADTFVPYFYMCQHVLDHVPDASKVDYRLVEDATHYSFLSPYPDALKSPSIPPSQDPPGFDRGAFLEGLYADIGAFLDRVMPRSS